METKAVIDEIRRLVAEHPDNKYPSDDRCYCVKGICTNGSVGCIVGQALVNLGVSADKLSKHEGNDAETVVRQFCAELPPTWAKWLIRLQEEQDAGFSWQYALEHANEIHGVPKL